MTKLNLSKSQTKFRAKCINDAQISREFIKMGGRAKKSIFTTKNLCGIVKSKNYEKLSFLGNNGLKFIIKICAMEPTRHDHPPPLTFFSKFPLPSFNANSAFSRQSGNEGGRLPRERRRLGQIGILSGGGRGNGNVVGEWLVGMKGIESGKDRLGTITANGATAPSTEERECEWMWCKKAGMASGRCATRVPVFGPTPKSRRREGQPTHFGREKLIFKYGTRELARKTERGGKGNDAGGNGKKIGKRRKAARTNRWPLGPKKGGIMGMGQKELEKKGASIGKEMGASWWESY
jgi:hypothetical protein